MADVTIKGTCDARFARVREAFADNFASRRETGASVALALDGRLVVDLWGGWADKARTRPWTRDTIVNVYSTTKGLTAICAHRLAGEGRLDLDGSVRPPDKGSPLSVAIKGYGRAGTKTEGWEYDYDAFLGHQWPSGVDQVPSLVGTVIRAKPHNGGPAGVTASFIAVKQS